jgi:hypothetical protein
MAESNCDPVTPRVIAESMLIVAPASIMIESPLTGATFPTQFVAVERFPETAFEVIVADHPTEGKRRRKSTINFFILIDPYPVSQLIPASIYPIIYIFSIQYVERLPSRIIKRGYRNRCGNNQC